MTQQTSPSDVAKIFDAEWRDDQAAAPFAESFNVAPTDPVTVVLQRDDGRVVERHRWGLIPAWASDPREGSRMINARAETVASSPAFRVAFRKRRCIVPSDGFYEWQRRDGKRQPFYIRGADGALLAMAGLWSIWKDPATGLWVPSCSVVTTQANDQMAPLHDRMPVLLDEEARWTWLDPDETDAAFLQSLLEPAPEGVLDLYPVSSRVNSVRNNGEDLISPIDVAVAGAEQATLFG
ncbi:MAG: SOS response-associated peptidase [Candidatus Limnocylindrales bacterium]